MNSIHWNDLAPSKRCDWIDLIRGWAVIVMVETHCINVWLRHDLMPHWLQFFNGLVAPGFIMCAGYSCAISIFNHDNSIRPFRSTAKRLAIILTCAYLLHAPGLALVKWSIVIVQQDSIFKIDVLQCIAFSILILNGLARIVRRPIIYAWLITCLAILVAIVAPSIWNPNIANGVWLPVRGLINGNTDQGVTSLFPLIPWFSFAAFGSALGILYRQKRMITDAEQTKWSEAQWLFVLITIGIILSIWGGHYAQNWLLDRHYSQSDQCRLYNMTLPSILQRLGIVCTIGGILGYFELNKKTSAINIIKIAGHESLLIYLLHIKIIFGLLLVDQVRAFTHWHHYSLDWFDTVAITIVIIVINLITSIWWHKLRKNQLKVKKIQKITLSFFTVWMFGIGIGLYNSPFTKPKNWYNTNYKSDKQITNLNINPDLLKTKNKN